MDVLICRSSLAHPSQCKLVRYVSRWGSSRRSIWQSNCSATGIQRGGAPARVKLHMEGTLLPLRELWWQALGGRSSPSTDMCSFLCKHENCCRVLRRLHNAVAAFHCWGCAQHLLLVKASSRSWRTCPSGIAPSPEIISLRIVCTFGWIIGLCHQLLISNGKHQ